MIERRFSAKAEEFYRKLVLPEEDRMRLSGAEWKGVGYRWFRSENVLPLEHYQRPESLPKRKVSCRGRGVVFHGHDEPDDGLLRDLVRAGRQK